MQPKLQSPIATTDSAFQDVVKSKLSQGQPIIALLRYNRHGGAHSYFILKHFDGLSKVLEKAHYKDALTLFFSQSFPIQGVVAPELKELATGFLKTALEDGEEAVFAVRLDATGILLKIDELQGFSTAEQIDEWFSRHSDARIMIGTLAFWENNSDKMITAYVPDADGQVRRGSY
jgi:hypothetical protein